MTNTSTAPKTIITTEDETWQFRLETIMPAKLVTKDDYRPYTTFTLERTPRWGYPESALRQIRDMINQHLGAIDDYKKVQADSLKESK